MNPTTIPKIGDAIPNTNLKYEAADITNLQNNSTDTSSITPSVPPPQQDQKLINGTQYGQVGAFDANNNFTAGKWSPDGKFTAKNATPTAIDTRLTAQSNLDTTQNDYQAEAKRVQDTITNISNGAFPLSADEQAQIDGLKQQFGQLIDQQKLTNTGAQGVANIRGYQTGAAEYDNTFQPKVIGSIVSAGLQKVAVLEGQMAKAVGDLTSSIKSNKIGAVKDAWNIYKEAETQRKDTLQKVIDESQKEIKEAQDRQDKIQTDIDNVAAEARKNGASDEIIKAITSQGTKSGAITAAGDWLQTGTGDLGDYLAYKRNALKAGTTPVGYEDFLKQQDARDASKEYNKAYATAKGKAAGEAFTPTPTLPEDIKGVGDAGLSKSGSILNVTGLSIPAFNFLTQGTTALTRMSSAERLKYMNEAQNWANNKNIDTATFMSQYKAYNDTLQQNITRFNNTKIAEGEVSGTIANLKTAAEEAGLTSLNGKASSLRAINAAKNWLKGNLNDKDTQKYAFHLNQLQSEMAYYNAATQGRSSTDQVDIDEAKNLIKLGIAAGSLDGMEEALSRSVEKMQTTLQGSVDRSRQQVWSLFGVGDKYQPTDNSTQDQLIKTEHNAQLQVEGSASSDPNIQQAVYKMLSTPDPTLRRVMTYSEILQMLQATGQIH